VPRPETPVAIGNPVPFDSEIEAPVLSTTFPVPVVDIPPKAFELLY
jgi:hypothetical protein